MYVFTSSKSLRIQLSSSSLKEIGFYSACGLSIECFGLGYESDLFCSSNRMFNCGCSLRPSVGLFISLYQVSAVFCLMPTFWGQRYFKQLKIKHRQFKYSPELPPDIFLFFCVIILVPHILYYISKSQCLYSGKRYFC